MCSENNFSEFLVWKDDEIENNYFDREKTLTLINLYKLNKPKVTSGHIKTMKKLWELIAREMSNAFKITIIPSKVENKFRVLERSYKKVVDNNNKTGRGLKTFEYQTEFDEIFGKRANYKPLILLTNNESIIPRRAESNSVDAIQIPPLPVEENGVVISIVENEDSLVQQCQASTSTPVLAPGTKRRRRNANRDGPFYKKRNDILVEMKNDLKSYYDKKLEIEKEKLEINKKKLEDRVKRTSLLEQRANTQDNFLDL